jgi:hypothetical protein
MANATRAPPDERGGNRQAKPKTTAPHPYSTGFCRSGYGGRRPKAVFEPAIVNGRLRLIADLFENLEKEGSRPQAVIQDEWASLGITVD